MGSGASHRKAAGSTNSKAPAQPAVEEAAESDANQLRLPEHASMERTASEANSSFKQPMRASVAAEFAYESSKRRSGRVGSSTDTSSSSGNHEEIPVITRRASDTPAFKVSGPLGIIKEATSFRPQRGVKQRRSMSSMSPNELHSGGLTAEEFVHYKRVLAASEKRILPWTTTNDKFGKKRHAVKAQHPVGVEDVGDQPKSEEVTKLLLAALANVPALFSEVPVERRRVCVRAMREQRFNRGQRVIRQGEDGYDMYIIAEGTCDVVIDKQCRRNKDGDAFKEPDTEEQKDGELVSDGEDAEAELLLDPKCEEVKVATLTVGAVIGELGALYRQTRTANVVVSSDTCVCYTLSQAAYRWICFQDAAKAAQDTLAQLRRVPMLAWLRNSQRVQIGQLFTRSNGGAVAPGQMCLDVDAGVFYYNTQNPTLSAEIDRLFAVAERLHGLFTSDQVDPADSSRVAATRVERAAQVNEGASHALYACSAADFAKLMAKFLPESSADEQRDAWLVRQLIHLELFKGSEQLSHAKWLLGEARRRILPIGTVFGNKVEGTDPEAFENSILIAGVVSNEASSDTKYESGTVRYYSGCAVLSKAQTRRFRCETACYILTMAADKVADWQGRTRNSLEKLQWGQVIVHEVIGLGSFGKVTRAEVLPDDQRGGKSRFFALKQLSKACITSKDQGMSLFAERNILATCAHPLVTRLVATFNVGSSLYLLMELLEGGALWTRLKKETNFCLGETVYYSGCVLLALRFLHHNCIAFRDVKPENVALSLDGLPKLIDFGFAKTIVERTYTLCGTPEYMAPEVLQNKGHDQAVDLWAVGVLIFDMLFGYTPFSAGGNEALVFVNILHKEVTMPDMGEFASALEPARDLILHLCSKNPFRRSGWETGDADDVLRHPFFAAMPLVEMAACKDEADIIKLAPPPWRPHGKALRKVDPQRIQRHDAKAIVAARNGKGLPEDFWSAW